MGLGKVFGIIAVVLFAVAFVVVLIGTGNAKLVLELELSGLASLAAAHVLP